VARTFNKLVIETEVALVLCVPSLRYPTTLTQNDMADLLPRYALLQRTATDPMRTGEQASNHSRGVQVLHTQMKALSPRTSPTSHPTADGTRRRPTAYVTKQPLFQSQLGGVRMQLCTVDSFLAQPPHRHQVTNCLESNKRIQPRAVRVTCFTSWYLN
jgi:hypothetical protein